MHDELKSVCMKIFPKLASKTNLDAEELQVYYAIRFQYIIPYSKSTSSHEESLLHLAQSLMRGGKLLYEINADSDAEESKQKVLV